MNNKTINPTKRFDEFARASGAALLAGLNIFDLAVSAEKMTRWDCIGEKNQAWKDGPYLSSYAGEEQIDRSRPYCIRLSKEFSVAASRVLGPNPNVEPNGGVKLPLSPAKAGYWGPQEFLAKLIIIEQFELYKEFALEFNGPTNPKSSKKWKGRVDNLVLEVLEELTNRRNKLTHNDPCQGPTIREAVDCYVSLRWIAKQISMQLAAEARQDI